MTLFSKSHGSTVILLTGIVLLSACEGDSRPFQESVEIATLGLSALQVTPPSNAQEMIYINTGQTLQVGILGTSDTTETSVVLSTSGRSFRSSNPAVLSVSDDGVVTGGAVPEDTALSAEISVVVGGLVSEALTINVSNGTLDSITSIEGSETLEVCLPDEYFAVGMFDDNTVRTLDSVGFDLAEGSEGELDSDGSATRLNATGGTAVSLIAQVGEITLTRQLQVVDTLDSIAITPASASIDVDETLELTATGTYVSAGAEPASGSRDITANIQWSINSGDDNASVGNSDDDKGQLSGIESGVAVVQAACGTSDITQQVVTVNDDTDDDSDELAFDIPGDDGVLTITLGSTDFQLQVSRGSEFELANEEDDVTYSVNNLGAQTAIDPIAILDGTVRPVTAGASAVVTATVPASGDEDEATGSITVTVVAP